MCNTKRVVVTGIGFVTPLGSNKESVWKELIEGKSAVSEISSFDTSEYSCKIAAAVKDFNPENYINNKKELRKMDRFLQFAIASSSMALEDSALDISKNNPENIGVVIGSGIGGMSTLENQFRVLFEKGPTKISPFFIPMMIANMVSGHVGIYFGLRGPNLSIITACATGAHSIGEAYEILKRGQAEVMVTGGSEAAITPISLAGFCSMKALSSKRNNEPQKASRPFDKDRDGFIMGEGAGILILENLDHAIKRGANIYAEVAGYGASADAYHITNPEPEGRGASLAMSKAISSAGITAEDINYINAHGTATPAGDKAETLAIKNTFGEYAKRLPISSTKSIIGHTLGAAGALESIFCILAINKGIIPPTINYEFPDPECDLDYVPNKARNVNINYAMSNSFGFGGQNAVLIFKKYSS